MKQLIIVILLHITFSVMGQQKKTHVLDIEKSTIHWKGSYLFQFSEHHGTVNFKKGSLQTENGMITGGSFIIDMTSISNEEYEKDKKMGPIGHLKNADFFDVTVHPEARLELTKVTYFENTNEHRFEGDLTIKGITKPIMIKAMADGLTNTVKTSFIISRQDWGISYQSKYKDSAISDAMAFDVKLVF